MVDFSQGQFFEKQRAESLTGDQMTEEMQAALNKYREQALVLGVKAYESAIEEGQKPAADKKDIFVASIASAYLCGIREAQREAARGKG